MGTKAIAGAGTTGIGGPLVIVLLWALNLNPPQDVIIALQAVLSGVLTYLAVYFTPHNGGGP